MEFKQLQSFVAVVDYGSFTKASEKLFISQPTISTHIRMLEDEFQSCLLVRTTKSIELTPRGQEFYECAVSILSLKNHLIESWTNESRNVIHMGTSTIPSTYLLPELLPAYKSCVRKPISIFIKVTARAFWTKFWKAALTWVWLA